MISGGFAKAETRIFSSNSLFFIALCFLKFQLETFLFSFLSVLFLDSPSRKSLLYRPKITV